MPPEAFRSLQARARADHGRGSLDPRRHQRCRAGAGDRRRNLLTDSGSGRRGRDRSRERAGPRSCARAMSTKACAASSSPVSAERGSRSRWTSPSETQARRRQSSWRQSSTSRTCRCGRIHWRSIWRRRSSPPCSVARPAPETGTSPTCGCAAVASTSRPPSSWATSATWPSTGSRRSCPWPRRWRTCQIASSPTRQWCGACPTSRHQPEGWADLIADVIAFVDPLLDDEDGALSRWSCDGASWR